MTDFVIVASLVLEVGILSYWERVGFKRWLTPFTVLACPYTAVVLIAYALGPALGFVKLFTKSILVAMALLFAFWGIGAVTSFVLHSYRLRNDLGMTTVSEERARIWALRLGSILAIVLAIQLYIAYSAAPIGTVEFKAAFSHGVLSHALILAIPVLTVLIGTINRQRRFQVLLACALFIFFLIGRVKGTALEPIAAGLFYRTITRRTRISLRTAIVFVLITFVVFNSIYFIGLGLTDPASLKEPDTYAFFARHYVFYLCSGVLAFGEAMRQGAVHLGGESAMIFAPFLNIYAEISGSRLEAVGSTHEKGMDIDTTTRDPDEASNVYTAPGTLYLYLGMAGALLYLLGLSCVCYLSLVSTRVSTSPWMLVLYTFLCAQLAFGFFEFYFWHLTALEVPAYCLLLMCLSKVRLVRSLSYVQPRNHKT